MTLRWGILGCARITRRGLVPGILGSTTSTLAALASRDRARAESWAREFNVPRAYGSYEELLADPEIDAVYIPLPNELHKSFVFAAADAGKQVLCEKPLALDSAEASAMVDHCRNRGVLMVEAFMWRHQPRTAELLEIVDEGRIGDLRLIRSSFSFPIEPDDWRLDPARGGGALWDVGCYGVNTARLFARSEPIAVRSRARFGATGVDLSLTAELQFGTGVLAVIDCSFEQAYRCSYELVGTRGVIEVPDAYLPPERPVARLRTESLSEELGFSGTNQYSGMVDAFARLAKGEKHVARVAEDGLAQMKVLDAALASARS
jgi:predicted dehydrogenase